MSHLTFNAIFISDLHIGSDITNYKKLFKFIEDIECKKLFLVGDIIYRNLQEPSLELERFIKLLESKECEVIYIIGNHEKSRKVPMPKILSSVDMHKNYIYQAIKYKILIEHGDSYDTKDKVLQSLKYIDKRTHIKLKNQELKKVIKKYLSHILKAIAKVVLHKSFSRYMILRAKRNRCNTVICGHFHKSAKATDLNINYLNCGDWIGNCTYIAEDFNGDLELYRYY